MGPFDFLTGGVGESEPLDPYRRPSIFEPSGGTTEGSFAPFGFAGRMMGIPTTGERLGVLEGQAVSDLSKLVEEGASPEQALTRYMQSPEGQKFFGAPGVNFAGTLEKFKSLVTPPPPTVLNPAQGTTAQAIGRTGQPVGAPLSSPAVPHNMTVGPGQTTRAIGPGGRTLNELSAPAAPFNTPAGTQTTVPGAPGQPSTTVSTAPQEAQNFKIFAGLGNLTDDEFHYLARQQATPDNLRESQMKERVISQLVKEGKVDPEFARKRAAGFLEITKLKNPAGDETGQISITDMSTNPPTSVVISPRPGVRGGITDLGNTHGSFSVDRPVDNPPNPGAITSQPSTIPREARGPDGRINWDKVDPKVTMRLGAGPTGAISNAITRGAEMIDPSLSPEPGSPGDLNQKRRVAMDNYSNALLSLSDRSGDLGTPKAIIDTVTELQEGKGFLASPKIAIEKDIQLHDRLSREVAVEKYSYTNDYDMPRAEKIKQAQRIAAYERVLRELPPVNDMRELLRDYGAGKTNVPGVVSAMGQGFTKSVDMVATVFGQTKTEIGKNKSSEAPVKVDPAAAAVIETLSPEHKTLFKSVPTMDEAQTIEAGKTLSTLDPAVQKVVGPIIAARAKELLVPSPRPRPAEAGSRANAPAVPQGGGSEGTGIPYSGEAAPKTGMQPFPGVNIQINTSNPRTPFEAAGSQSGRKSSPFYRGKKE